ncbi:AAA family ATPase [Shewanella rhizosphaerae]|uniref:AAA family ATPase n=1 Tax=Shewanella rhizosphaerae TaxID=2864207 RepID=UPI001C65EF01|nr:AAA family ATPase [Shewanella rhizosphaerae]QYK13158.1 AAA family ATPase [Shewanella rhizosphaerae]
MTFQTAILLPSQESLLHRLQHVVLYGQQLTVLTGDAGAGKTTLTTALVDTLDDVSSALVVCPQHVDSAEIRRKILVQLLTEPVFDDEVPLPETLLRLCDTLPSHSHIVLDDVQYLPLELWAECIVLSQLSLAGRKLSLTMTAPADYLNQILAQLPDTQRPLLLPVAISPLTMPEREGLYYTLLHRSEETPFTPREIVKDQLQRQQGTPAEVVNLLYLALHGESTTPKKRPWPVYLAIGACMAFLLASLYWFWTEAEDVVAKPKVQTVAAVRADAFNQGYGQILLSGYFDERGRLSERVQESADVRVEAAEVARQSKTQPEDELEDELESEIESEIEGAYSQDEALAHQDEHQAEQALLSQQDTPVQTQQAQWSQASGDAKAVDKQVETFAVEPVSEPNESRNLGASTASMLHPTGYTLQLATVKRLESLDATIAKLPDANQVQIARYKSYWVLLYGQYTDRQAGKQAALDLAQTALLPSPWLRAWVDLSGYELQQGSVSREIH